jgi:hypothetical protein
MSRVFDYGGTIVAASNPVKKLKTVKKTLVIDSGDRDTVKYATNGEFVVYLPRVYENVVGLRLEAAEFPASPITGYLTPAGVSTSGVTVIGTPLYFLVDIEGLNKTDETAVGANRSGFPDGFFAKIPISNGISNPIFYCDKSQQDNTSHLTPAVGKLDRLHIRTRLHSQKIGSPTTGNIIYWTSANFSLTFEVEYLDNVFDDFSQFESRVAVRD